MYVPTVPITRGMNTYQHWRFALIVAALYFGLMESILTAGPPRVLPPGTIPADTRLGPLKGERGDFPFIPAHSSEEWERRKKDIRRILRVTLGLWPMHDQPERLHG